MTDELATLTDRVKVNLTDLLLVLISMGVVSEILSQFSNVQDWVRILLLGLTVLYEPLFTSTACTLGQKIVGVRVRNFEKLFHENKEERISFVAALIRMFSKIILGSVTYITFFTSDQKRMIHDFASNSIVIKRMRTIGEPQQSSPVAT